MNPSPPSISVVIPCLNDGQVLNTLLGDLRRQHGVDLQIIVADGGSQDTSLDMAKQMGAQCVSSAAGRGRQMNAGHAQATHAWLLFLHADSRLCDETMLAKALQHMQTQKSCSAGHFGLAFDRSNPGAEPLFQHLENKSRLNRPETINGDQGLLIEARFLHALGGFDERLPFLEDQALSERIFREGQWILLPGALHTSARRFEVEGPGRRYFLMMLIMCARRAGLEQFFSKARDLYPQQAQARALKVGPFLDLLLELGQAHPRFWNEMAAYLLDNAWQPFFMLDQKLDTQGFLDSFDRLANATQTWPSAALSRRLLQGALAPGLKILFSGPIRAYLHDLDRRISETQREQQSCP